MEATVVLRAVGFGFRVQGGKGMKQNCIEVILGLYRDNTPIMENQMEKKMEKKMENEMETGIISISYCIGTAGKEYMGLLHKPPAPSSAYGLEVEFGI